MSVDQISRNLEKALSISDKADDSTPLLKPRPTQSTEIQCEILKGGKVRTGFIFLMFRRRLVKAMILCINSV